MTRYIHTILACVLAHHCCAQNISFKKIEIDTTYVFRGLSVVDDEVAWVSGKNGVVGMSVDGGVKWVFAPLRGGEKMDFRTLYAFNSKEAVIANAGSPACIMRTNDGGVNWSTVYTNDDPAAFIDGADFWNDNDGIIYGDPIKGHMLLLQTADGGKTWKELPEQSRPTMAEGEASFAASGTGIRCYGKNKVVFSTGGKASRLLISNDKGHSWKATNTPIMQGLETTGIFSLAFADGHGIIVGGDYKNDTLRRDHVFYTHDGGKKWTAPAIATAGQRECVEYLGKQTVIATGVSGVDISEDEGMHWKAIPGQDHFAVIRKARKGKLTIAAGRARLSIVSLNVTR